MQQLRHVTSINDLTVDEIETIFSLADTYLKELRDPYLPHRIGKSITEAQGSILASLFYEPSTRTRLSFESAMLRLGGNIYYTSKLGATDGLSFQNLAALMTGTTQEQYAQMMIKGGRSVENNRSKSEWKNRG